MDDLYKKLSELPQEKRRLLEAMLQEQGVDLSKLLIVPQSRDGNQFPLSYSQQRLWFLDKLEPDSALYNIAPALRLKGPLNVSALTRSFSEIIRRHEVLRTVFHEIDGEPVQIINPPFEMEIPVVGLEDVSADRLDDKIRTLAVKEATTPFNLSTGPLMRVRLLRISEEDHVLLVTMHHIVSDNWSTGLLIRELMALYDGNVNGTSVRLPDLPVQYADFAAWQRKWLSGKTLENQLTYWKKQLAGVDTVLNMPLDFPRPAYMTTNGDYITFSLDEETSARLNNLARQNDVTLFMLLTALFEVLLYKYSGQQNFCLGTPIANRNRQETETLIGFFVNTLVLRADIAGDLSFTGLLKYVKETTLNAYAHQDLPFETLVESLQPERNMSTSPLFQVMFVLNNAPMQSLQLSGLDIELLEFENKTSKFELILNAYEDKTGLKFKLEFNTDLYLPDTINRLISHYRQLISSVLDNPGARLSDLEMMTVDEKHLLLSVWSQPEKQYNQRTNLVRLIEKQAEVTPQNVALKLTEEQLTYADLNERANRLAHLLAGRGIKAGQIVGVCLDRSADLIVAMLAVFKSGGVYLPLDPTYPADRLNFMLTDSRAVLLITRTDTQDQFKSGSAELLCMDTIGEQLAAQSPENLNLKIRETDTAYVIYTSGSTGQPKGVEVSHYAISNHCLDIVDYYQLSPQDNVLQFAALNFDASLEQILPTFMAGATLCMRENDIWEISKFHEKIIQFDLTVINLPTAYWNQLCREWAEHAEQVPSSRLRLVIVGGDVFSADALTAWHKTAMRHIRLLNAYGPTEAVITSATFEVPEDFSGSHIPIGRARANRHFYILDTDGHPVPIGIAGELHIGGDILAKGYLDQPGLTAGRFIENPFSEDEGRLYKSGDLVRWLPDGNVEFIGRVDDQVKLRGFRLEPGEIVHQLQTMPEIKEAIVTLRRDNRNEKFLAAYYVPAEGCHPSLTQMRDYLLQKLPDYMVPAAFVELDQLPLDPSGKIDRRSLPDPELARLSLNTEFIAPRNETEETLAGIVQTILNIEKVGIHDNFFELGGHSMMATQVISRIREHFDVELSLRTLFERPTVEQLALAITEARAGDQDNAELESMLDEIENLSNDEIDKLLNEE